MRKKFIICFIIIFTMIICKYNIIYATEETSIVKIFGDIDAEKNITLNIQTKDTRVFEGIIDYDVDVLEFVEIKGKNNWKASLQDFNITAITENVNNSEMLDILSIKFKLKNPEDIIDSNISVTEIKIVKDDKTKVNLGDLDTTITINEDKSTINDDENIQEEDEIDDTVEDSSDENNEDDEISQEDEDVYAEEQTIDSPSENDIPIIEKSEIDIEYEDELDDEGNYKKVDENKKNVDKSVERNMQEDIKETQKENLANNTIPQTGLIITIVPILIISASVIITYYFYKKYNI